MFLMNAIKKTVQFYYTRFCALLGVSRVVCDALLRLLAR